MIPEKLRLRNFMCYREEQSLDFAGIHLACLAGDNGHGKSALLDAMTWALWGKSRSRRDDDLISLGESDMWVEFEFGLGKERYRIWRQRNKRAGGHTDLHFYVQRDPASGGDEWQCLDEGGVRERQALITRTLRLEYETFTNSAFLLQGRADSFTTKTPGERKQILGEILGLERYDQYEERARDEAQRRKAHCERVQGEVVAVDRELAKKPLFETQLATARAKVAEAAVAFAAAEADRQRMVAVLQHAEAQQRSLQELRARLARAERDLDDGRRSLVSGQARLAGYEVLIAQREDIERGWNELQAARREDGEWNRRLLEHSTLQDKVNRVRMAVNQARLGLENERQRFVDRQKDLERRMTLGQAQMTILLQAQEILAHLSAQAVRRDIISSELRQLVEQIAAAKAENEAARREGQDLNEKVDMLREAATASCPLCGQGLSDDHRHEMLAGFKATRDRLAESYQANQGLLKTLTERKRELEAEDAELERELKARDARQRQAMQAENAVVEGQAAAEEGEKVAADIAALDARLAERDYAAVEQAELKSLEAALAKSGYDSAAHQAVRSRLEQQEAYDARYQSQLQPALREIDTCRREVDEMAARQARREAELSEDRRQADALAVALADLPALQREMEQANTRADGAAAAERRARQEEGAAMQQLNVLGELAERRAELMALVERLNEEISVFNQLREAFGKKGLQAMIIESAIPEVETEANRLLGRMSDGRMNLRLETQREKVTGGVAETLDIIIADELGSRPYEMYSGGEAFRANLALRIAISKLLARRAGAQLQTLVIDEGFGTQDALGRALLVEAISSIQHDFERILVITHIEELKDLFPARIDITKTAHGSQIRVA